MKIFKLMCLFAVLLSGCNKDDKEMILVVASEKRSCITVDDYSCYVVKDKGSDVWRYMSSSIIGFDYEPGYEYTIKISVRNIKNPPQDGSSKEYTLRELISKEKKESENLPPKPDRQ